MSSSSKLMRSVSLYPLPGQWTFPSARTSKLKSTFQPSKVKMSMKLRPIKYSSKRVYLPRIICLMATNIMPLIDRDLSRVWHRWQRRIRRPRWRTHLSRLVISLLRVLRSSSTYSKPLYSSSTGLEATCAVRRTPSFLWWPNMFLIAQFQRC